MMAAFSMASMTDVIFLLLIFFMVTSTFVFPTALKVNLPQSSQQTSLKPTIRIYLDAEGNLATTVNDTDPQPITTQELRPWLQLAVEQEPESVVALYADETVPYGSIVELLNIGAEINVKIVLATQPSTNQVVAPGPSADGESAEIAEIAATDAVAASSTNLSEQ